MAPRGPQWHSLLQTPLAMVVYPIPHHSVPICIHRHSTIAVRNEENAKLLIADVLNFC